MPETRWTKKLAPGNLVNENKPKKFDLSNGFLSILPRRWEDSHGMHQHPLCFCPALSRITAGSPEQFFSSVLLIWLSKLVLIL